MARFRSVLAASLALALVGACDGGDEDPEPTPAEIFLAGLQGSWAECKAADSQSRFETLTFANTQLTVTSILYSAADCTGTVVSTGGNTGTIAVGAQVATTLDGVAVTAFAVDVSVGAETNYDLWYVDEAATPDRLYSGDKSGLNDGSTPELRPTVLFAGRYLARQ